jgi:hypothetical protein
MVLIEELGNILLRKCADAFFMPSAKPKRRRPHALLEPEFAIPHALMKWVARGLNGEMPQLSEASRTKLTELVEAWAKSGPDWENFGYWWKLGKDPDDIAHQLEMALDVRVRFKKGPRAYLMPEPAGLPPSTGRVRDDPTYLFATLVLDPDCGDFWGGRCRRCQKFYVKKSRGQTHYCSLECRSRRPTKEYKAAARERIFKVRLRSARDARKAFGQLPLPERQRVRDPYTWIAEKASAMLLLRDKADEREAIKKNTISKRIEQGKLAPPAI